MCSLARLQLALSGSSSMHPGQVTSQQQIVVEGHRTVAAWMHDDQHAMTDNQAVILQMLARGAHLLNDDGWWKSPSRRTGDAPISIGFNQLDCRHHVPQHWV